ncbi:hypothetical protein GCM10027404_09520 [Arthrobacter tumbae]|uniref:DUF2997 domain-containing protein n=1 Tax=Arthrobacter tumbae TaxID=163874 RepID=UPI00195AA966|nr:hypothetical protein [Arthrobacter tumbae]
MSKRIRVTVSPDGQISATIEGHEGPSCMDELGTVSALFPGATIVDSRLTPEYYHRSASTTTQVQPLEAIVEDER